MSDDIISRIRTMVEPFLERERLALYDVEVVEGGRSVLRLFIDRAGGVTITHCQEVSRFLSAALDVEDVFKGPFTLEVSSPGLTRKLKKPEHFVKSAGSVAKVTFKKEFEGPLQAIGTLESLGDGRFRLIPKPDGDPVVFTFDDVAKARLEIDV